MDEDDDDGADADAEGGDADGSAVHNVSHTQSIVNGDAHSA
jgi:hypothetical protein